MATILIRNASLFSPDPLGTNDILIINDRIAAMRMSTLPEEAVRRGFLLRSLLFRFQSLSARV